MCRAPSRKDANDTSRLPSREAGKWPRPNARGSVAPHASVAGERLDGMWRRERRHPRHTVTLTKQRLHVLMAAESETHGFNFLQNTHGYKKSMQESHLANSVWVFPEPRNGEKLSEMVAELKLPPGSSLPTHSPGLMRCETPAVFLERGRCLLCGTSAAAISTDFLLSAISSFAQPLPPESRQGDLILAADRDPCLRVDRG